MKNVKFNKKFMIGSATSGPQTEAFHNLDNKSDTVWDFWYKKEPESFFKKQFVQGGVRKNFKSYVDKASELKLDSLRTSIQWSRLLPDGHSLSSEGVNFYREYFSYIKSKKIKVFVNLYHFDMPMWLYKKGGFENKEAIDLFVKYAKQCFELFGDLVDTWFTFNEPIVPVEMGYMNIYHLPRITDIKKGMQVLHNFLIAHLKTVKVLHAIKPKAKIGIVLNITPVIPATKNDQDVEAAHFAEDFYYRCYLDPIFKGEYPKRIVNHAKANNYMWEITPEEAKLIASKQGLDILGLNYYQPKRVQHIKDPKSFTITKSFEGQVFDPYKWPEAVINKYRGWEIFPKGIYQMLMFVKKHYNNPNCFIAENGIGIEDEKRFEKNGVIQDDYRIDFYKNHLYWVKKAIDEGSNCLGYHIWTFVDNWSWLNAYKNRYGVVSLSLKTKSLHNKKSFEWFKDLATKKEFVWK